MAGQTLLSTASLSDVTRGGAAGDLVHGRGLEISMASQMLPFMGEYHGRCCIAAERFGTAAFDGNACIAAFSSFIDLIGLAALWIP
jgi:hypothetical protein